MDMKKILQAMDGAKTKAEVNSSEMKRFLRAVTESDLNQTVIENIEDLGNGAQKKTNPDGTYEIGDGSGLKLYSADGKLIKTISPNFAGFSQETDHTTGNVTKNYSSGPLNTSQTTNKAGKVISTKSTADLGVGVLGFGQDEKGITSKSWSARAPEQDDIITQKDMYALGNKDKEATYDRAMKQVAQTNENVGMSRFLSIVTEGKGPLNRLTAAESIAVNHYSAPAARQDITSKVLNVKEGATPGMFGKYFKTVEQEFAESAERSKDRARLLAERVVERILPGEEPAPGINRLTGKPIAEPTAPAAPAAPTQPLSSRYGPGYEGSPAAYMITVSGKDYKFAGRDKQGPGTGEIIKVPGGAVGIRGLAPVSVELGQDGMFYIAAPAN